MVAMGIDFLALSGHKMYAPFGGGVLIGPSAVLADAEPMLAGGGAVTYVTTDDVQWAPLPDRHEAGSPNVVGAIALGAACTVLDRDRHGAHRRAREASARLSRRTDRRPPEAAPAPVCGTGPTSTGSA